MADIIGLLSEAGYRQYGILLNNIKTYADRTFEALSIRIEFLERKT
jgi:hypothetical protein